jgi:hypothetical protein
MGTEETKPQRVTLVGMLSQRPSGSAAAGADSQRAWYRQKATSQIWCEGRKVGASAGIVGGGVGEGVGVEVVGEGVGGVGDGVGSGT